MGLDLFHVILSAKNDKTWEYFYLDELRDRPGFVENHKALITEIIETDNFFTIYLFSCEDHKSEYQQIFKDSRCRVLLVGSIDGLTSQITGIESENCLSLDDKSISEGCIDDGIGTFIPYIAIKYPIEDSKEQVIYWKSIGYQRKRMSLDFYNDFENCKLYFRKSDVLKAVNYLCANNKELPRLIECFKEGFIDNFIDGRSIFFASW